jgi:glycosidase
MPLIKPSLLPPIIPELDAQDISFPVQSVPTKETMSTWPPCPSIFEINTWVWLSTLKEKYSPSVTLGSVPSSEWDSIAKPGFDAVWLMGVWERSPAGLGIANRNQGLTADFRRALTDFRIEDNVGSPYCVRRYVVDQHLGGPSGLATARNELAKRGVRLILDFVPNHVAPDHPWAMEHAEYFIQGTPDDSRNDPASYIEINGKVFACGRDPYFPAWPDVLQLNAFHPGLRQGVIETISDIASQCDGIRCDMAMLLLNAIVERTWGNRAGQRPSTEYWTDVIPAVKSAHPGFLFIAEAYWELEWELQQKGFDFCYDKRLYDRLEHGNAESVRLHLCAGLDYQAKLLRFLENHDEPRAAATFSPAKHRAAAVTVSTLPGARLFHDGQFDGRKIRIPVFLGRPPKETFDPSVQAFYAKLLKAIDSPLFRNGQWSLSDCTGWPDNQSFKNLVAWNWISAEERALIVVNLSNSPAQAMTHVPWADIEGKTLHLVDELSGVTYNRSGTDIRRTGLYVDLGPWMSHLFNVT